MLDSQLLAQTDTASGFIMTQTYSTNTGWPSVFKIYMLLCTNRAILFHAACSNLKIHFVWVYWLCVVDLSPPLQRECDGKESE